MALPTTFTGNLTPTGEQLDGNFSALGALTPIPCVVSGTSALTFTPLANVPAVPAYSNYMQFTGVSAGTNAGAATAQVGALAPLSIYKDSASGSVLLTGGELVTGTKIILMYDAALNGFHLIAPIGFFARTHTTTASISLAALLPQTGTTATVTLSGTSVGDIVNLGYPSLVSVGLTWSGYVNNAGTITLNAFNATSGTVTPNAGTYRIVTQGF